MMIPLLLPVYDPAFWVDGTVVLAFCVSTTLAKESPLINPDVENAEVPKVSPSP